MNSYKFLVADWEPYCGDKCPGVACNVQPPNICSMADRLGCNGRFKELFEKGCQKTCGFCVEKGKNWMINQSNCLNEKKS